MIILTGEITHQFAKCAAEHMMAFTVVGDEPINMIISSPNVYVESGDIIHNIIKFVRPKVRTIGSGWTAI